MATNIEVWAGYAKDRFESAAKRVDEFRNWARQLSAAVAVVIGLELTLVAKVLDLKATSVGGLWILCLGAFLLAVAIHICLLWWLLYAGYRSKDVLYPESPVVLATYVVGQEEQETRRMIGAYYAKACDRFHELSKNLGAKVGRATQVFAASTLLLLLGVLLWVRLAALRILAP